MPSAMSQDQSFECNAPDVVFENFGDEVILLNLESGNYYSLDPIGMRYWEYLSQGVPAREITAHLGGHYAAGKDPAAIAKDLDTLLSEFVAFNLIRPSNTSRTIADVATGGGELPAEYAAPAISKYDDVAEMLLLDPVHDVGEAGWPQPAPVARKQE